MGLTASGFGQYVAQNYEQLYFSFYDAFAAYHQNHIMAPILAKLKEGLDEVSCSYIDYHEKLLGVIPLAAHTLLNKQAIYTAVDRQLLERNQQMVAAGQPPFLQQVNLEWSSSYTNFYGLYDTPAELLQRINGKAVIDGGAFIGDTMVLFRNLFPASPLYAFEPSTDSYKQLCELLKDDIASGRLTAKQLALGDKPGSITLQKTHTDADSRASTIMEFNKPELNEQVEMITLDDFVKEHQVQVGLLKLDVEGAEPTILQGALNTIKEQKPLLIIAMYHTPEEFYELKPYLESLNLGYKFMIRRSCFSSPLCEMVLIGLPA